MDCKEIIDIIKIKIKGYCFVLHLSFIYFFSQTYWLCKQKIGPPLLLIYKPIRPTDNYEHNINTPNLQFLMR